jgi:hypothetical protein
MAGKKKPKTIDERLDGLTHTVELLAHMQLTTEKEIQQLTRLTSAIAANHGRRITALERRRG